MPLPPERAFAPVTPRWIRGRVPEVRPAPAVTGVHEQERGRGMPWARPAAWPLSDGESCARATRSGWIAGPLRVQLTDFQKLFGSLVRGDPADWRFEAADGGTGHLDLRRFHALPGAAGSSRSSRAWSGRRATRRVLPAIADSTPRLSHLSFPSSGCPRSPIAASTAARRSPRGSRCRRRSPANRARSQTTWLQRVEPRDDLHPLGSALERQQHPRQDQQSGRSMPCCTAQNIQSFERLAEGERVAERAEPEPEDRQAAAARPASRADSPRNRTGW